MNENSLENVCKMVAILQGWGGVAVYPLGGAWQHGHAESDILREKLGGVGINFTLHCHPLYVHPSRCLFSFHPLSTKYPTEHKRQ